MGVTGKHRALAAYSAGLALLACVGFFSPFWFLGFIPLGVGLVWASYDLVDVEVTGGDTPSAPQ